LVGRTLITTSDERTWPKDTAEPVLFLGEWCRRYSRKHVWSKYDAKVAPYHWDDRTKLYEDYQYLTEVYEKLLALLVEKLNDLHGVNHSQRYWRILVGPWLGHFIQMLFDRWYMLKDNLDKKGITKICFLERDEYELIPNDMAAFNAMFVTDDWNEAVYSQIIRLLQTEGIESVDESILNNKKPTQAQIKHSGRGLLKSILENILLTYSKLVSKRKGAFFISSYLPLKLDIKLQLKLGQLPTVWRSQPCPIIPVSREKRDWRAWSNLTDLDLFSKVAVQLISRHIPIVYLEGYQKLSSYPDKLGWPSEPNMIFTSNAYLSDDVFKQWAAEKTENNIPLVIGQHGGHFGMNPFSFHEEHQIYVADKWLSWGWTDQNRPQITRVGILKTFNRDVSYDSRGGALLVEMTMPRQSYHLYAVSISRQWIDYYNEQKRFVDALSEHIQQQVQIRLFHHDYGWDQVDRWKDAGYQENLELGKENICKLISKCRLFVSTYNATTYLESMTWNVPTIMFWNPSHWELNDEAHSYFEQLKAVGIFHETPESAAKQMCKVWDDVDAWWHSGVVQSVRKKFCQQYAYQPENQIEDLATLFNQISQ